MPWRYFTVATTRANSWVFGIGPVSKGMAAAQIDLYGVEEMAKYFGPRPVLVGGLVAPAISESVQQDVFVTQVDRLTADCRLILSTSSGIYSWEQAERLMELYNSWPAG